MYLIYHILESKFVPNILYTREFVGNTIYYIIWFNTCLGKTPG